MFFLRRRNQGGKLKILINNPNQSQNSSSTCSVINYLKSPKIGTLINVKLTAKNEYIILVSELSYVCKRLEINRFVIYDCSLSERCCWGSARRWSCSLRCPCLLGYCRALACSFCRGRPYFAKHHSSIWRVERVARWLAHSAPPTSLCTHQTILWCWTASTSWEIACTRSTSPGSVSQKYRRRTSSS